MAFFIIEPFNRARNDQVSQLGKSADWEWLVGKAAQKTDEVTEWLVEIGEIRRFVELTFSFNRIRPNFMKQLIPKNETQMT